MMSLMPWTPWRRTSSTTRNASRIDVFFGDDLALGALEAERLGDHADRQRTELLGNLGDDRRRARSCAAAHARGQEDHVRVAQGFGDLLGILLGRPLTDRCIATGAEPARDLVADADLVGRVRLEECLRVRVAGDELHAHHLGPDHAVHGVAAAASDADHADEGEVLRIGPKRHRLSSGGIRVAYWSVPSAVPDVTVRGDGIRGGARSGRV